MLHDQGLSLHLWAGACNTTIYLQKQSPHEILGMITPEEDFLGRKSDVSHFRDFGDSIYCHVSKDSRKKLELTTKFGIFVGYTEAPHNYRVYLTSLKMTIVQRDANFDEDKVMQALLRGRFRSHQKKRF